jgi:cobalt-zinc-cadmium efflux system outer membrane protein
MSPDCRAFLSCVALLFCCSAWAEELLPSQPLVPPEPSGDLTLADCLVLVLEQNPELAAYAWEPRMAEARSIQAGLRPNPELSLAVEDIGVGGRGGESSSSSNVSFSPASGLGLGMEKHRLSDSSGGLDASEVTLSLSQLIELGGKRMKRLRLAHDEERVVDLDYEVLRAEILASTASAYYEVLVLQHRLEMATSFAQFASDAHAITQARVQAGKISPLEETRSDVELLRIRLESEHAEHELSAARIKLASHWGSVAPAFTKVMGSLSVAERPEGLDGFLARIEQSPDLLRWNAERERRESSLNVERANGKPNITLTAGVRSTGGGGRGSTSGFGLSTTDGARLFRGSVNGDDQEQSVLVGVSVPLPLFHRNQGRIREAELAVEQVSDQERALQIQLRATVSAEWQALVATYDEIKTLEEAILPKAQQAFEATQEGYRQGKFGLVDVLLSQRALFDAREELLETFARHHEAKVELERFTGQSVGVEADAASPIEEAKP